MIAWKGTKKGKTRLATFPFWLEDLLFGFALRVDEEEIVELHPLLRTDDALIATEDILGVDMADH